MTKTRWVALVGGFFLILLFFTMLMMWVYVGNAVGIMHIMCMLACFPLGIASIVLAYSEGNY
jgi:formate/nitrite transporter FocA (FNT family)